MEIFMRQERLDREMAPVLALCPRCGGELYQPSEAEQFGGLCPQCAEALRPGPDDEPVPPEGGSLLNGGSPDGENPGSEGPRETHFPNGSLPGGKSLPGGGNPGSHCHPGGFPGGEGPEGEALRPARSGLPRPHIITQGGNR